MALGSIAAIKTSEGSGIPAELFQILKDDAVKMMDALSMPANLENSPVAAGMGRVSYHSNLKEEECQRMSRVLHNCAHFTR